MTKVQVAYIGSVNAGSGVRRTGHSLANFLKNNEEIGLDISPSEFERERWVTLRRIVGDIKNRVGLFKQIHEN